MGMKDHFAMKTKNAKYKFQPMINAGVTMTVDLEKLVTKLVMIVPMKTKNAFSNAKA